ncbi:hypothetical protein [Chelativorans sp.]|uniref:hypothetical protein n=1 Tax=Chelativorans sp. TaxID=2203393 RepID=UPI0028113A5F|nr:hypothetical protein [Chelativorans sp.]
MNFASMAPQDAWIERLAPGGRLVMPLGVPSEPVRPNGPRFSRHGGIFVVRRQEGGFEAAYLCRAFFVFAEGGAQLIDMAEEERLEEAFRRGGAELVRSLVWKRPTDPARCWLCTPRWSLSYEPIGGKEWKRGGPKR